MIWFQSTTNAPETKEILTKLSCLEQISKELQKPFSKIEAVCNFLKLDSIQANTTFTEYLKDIQPMNQDALVFWKDQIGLTFKKEGNAIRKLKFCQIAIRILFISSSEEG